MNVGGYQILDLKKFDFDKEGDKRLSIGGVYDLIEASIKPILIVNFSIDGIDGKNVITTPVIGSDGDFYLNIAFNPFTELHKIFVVKDTDTIYYSEV